MHGRRDPVLELQFELLAIVRNSFVCCNSMSADRSRMAVLRFLAAAAACVILLCFAAGSRKSHCTMAA